MRAFPYQSKFDTESTPPWDRLTDTVDHRMEAMANWTNGVYPGGDGWKVEPGTGMTVKVRPGMGRVQGVFCYDEETPEGVLEPRVLALQSAHASLDRIDRVVVRHMDGEPLRKTDLYIKAGTASLNPSAPGLTRNSDVYELGIADIFVARGTNFVSAQRITDTRLDSSLCGLCTTRVMDKAIDEIKQLLNTAIDDTAAGYLQNQINTNKTAMEAASYPLTDSSLKSIYGSTATMKDVLAKLGAKFVVERNADYPNFTNNVKWEKYSDGTAKVSFYYASTAGTYAAEVGNIFYYYKTLSLPFAKARGEYTGYVAGKLGTGLGWQAMPLSINATNTTVRAYIAGQQKDPNMQGLTVELEYFWR